jgi:hypothetical protein
MLMGGRFTISGGSAPRLLFHPKHQRTKEAAGFTASWGWTIEFWLSDVVAPSSCAQQTEHGKGTPQALWCFGALGEIKLPGKLVPGA